jgi:TatD DNase family protein
VEGWKAAVKGLWIDTHCHLEGDQLDETLRGLDEAQVGGLVVVGTDVESSKNSVNVARAIRDRSTSMTVGASVGVHPHEAKSFSDADYATLRALLEDDQGRMIVGVGECGLDYFYEHSPRGEQRSAFEAQIDLARESDRTLIIHTRDAWSDTFEILESRKLPTRIVFHCFIGGRAEMQRSLELGAYISVSGIVTFKNSHELREVVQLIPQDRILVETDSPYLTPVPFRGRPNEPRHVAITGEFLANLRNVDVATFQEETSSNAIKAFDIASR